MKILVLAMVCLWLSGCATVAQQNHGQPVVFPAALKSQLAAKRISVAEHYESGCYAPEKETATSADAWQPAALVPREQVGAGDFLVDYTFWGCEDLMDGIQRHVGNYVLTAFSALIIPTHYETYANLHVRVYKSGKQVYEGNYREMTKHNLFGLVAIPIVIVQSLVPAQVRESGSMTVYRNLTRQFAADVASEYIFD